MTLGGGKTARSESGPYLDAAWKAALLGGLGREDGDRVAGIEFADLTVQGPEIDQEEEQGQHRGHNEDPQADGGKERAGHNQEAGEPFAKVKAMDAEDAEEGEKDPGE